MFGAEAVSKSKMIEFFDCLKKSFEFLRAASKFRRLHQESRIQNLRTQFGVEVLEVLMKGLTEPYSSGTSEFLVVMPEAARELARKVVECCGIESDEFSKLCEEQEGVTSVYLGLMIRLCVFLKGLLEIWDRTSASPTQIRIWEERIWERLEADIEIGKTTWVNFPPVLRDIAEALQREARCAPGEIIESLTSLNGESEDKES